MKVILIADVKNVGKFSCILYWRIVPRISSLPQVVKFSAPISSINNNLAFLT